MNVYICNVKGLEEVEKLGKNENNLHRWPKSIEMSDYIRPYQEVWGHLFGSKSTTRGLKNRKWSSTSGITHQINHKFQEKGRKNYC